MKGSFFLGLIFITAVCLGFSAAVSKLYHQAANLKGEPLEPASSPPILTTWSASDLIHKPTINATADTKPSPTILVLATQRPSETRQPTGTASPTATLAYQFLMKKPGREFGLVTSVIDGNTIFVLVNRRFFKVRYIGVEVPPLDAEDPAQADQALSAARANEELVLGKIVMLVKDVSETDQSGRLLRYVFVGGFEGAFVNYLMIKNGMAKVGYIPPDTACIEILTKAEELARQEPSWFWGSTPTSTPTLSTPGQRWTSTPTTSATVPGFQATCIPYPAPGYNCGGGE